MVTYREAYNLQMKLSVYSSLGCFTVGTCVAAGLQYSGMPVPFRSLPLILFVGVTLVSVVGWALARKGARDQLFSAPNPDAEIESDGTSVNLLEVGLYLALMGALLGGGAFLARATHFAQISQDMMTFEASPIHEWSSFDVTAPAEASLGRKITHAVFLQRPDIKKDMVCVRETNGTLSFWYADKGDHRYTIDLVKLPLYGGEEAHFTAVCDAALSAKGS